MRSKGILLFIFNLILFMHNLDKPMVYILDEAKNAECAREMLISGDYIMPYFNGQLRTDKPPLHYFFMVWSYKLFGVSAFSVRFFSAVFGALTILISFLFCSKYLGEKAGSITAMVLLSSLHFNFQMRMSVPDPYLIFLIKAGFMCFYLFLTERRKLLILLMYTCFGPGQI
jgi:4-amino-4-deoxy-L-arabinose transferase-like glycosyltransferase